MDIPSNLETLGKSSNSSMFFISNTILKQRHVNQIWDIFNSLCSLLKGWLGLSEAVNVETEAHASNAVEVILPDEVQSLHILPVLHRVKVANQLRRDCVILVPCCVVLCLLTLYATSFMVETFFLSLGMLKEGVSCLFIFFQVSPFRSARPNWFRFGGVNPC